MRKTQGILLLSALMFSMTACNSADVTESKEYRDLKKQYESMSAQYESMSSKADELLDMYAEVKADYELLKRGLTVEETTATVTTQPTTTIAPMEEETIFEGVKQYHDGMYKVGVDIPEGKYMLYSFTERGAYFELDSDANGNNIIANANFDSNNYIEIKNGEYLTLSRCYAFDYNDLINEELVFTARENCQLVVGRDIQAGEYKVMANSDKSAYYCIYDDWRQDSIVANGNFDNTAYVDLKDGDILELHRCKILE